MDPKISNRVVERAKEGEEEAWVEIFTCLWPRLHHYFMSWLPFQDAEDMAAEVFAKMVKAIKAFEIQEGVPFEGWAFRIAANTKVSYYRKVSGKETDSLSYRDDASWQAEQRLFSGIELSEYCRYLGDVLPKEQLIIGLHAFFGLNYAQIGFLLGTSEGTVKGRACKARRKLRDRVFGKTKVASNGNGHLNTVQLVRIMSDCYKDLPRRPVLPFVDALLLSTKFETLDRSYRIEEAEDIFRSFPDGFMSNLAKMLNH